MHSRWACLDGVSHLSLSMTCSHIKGGLHHELVLVSNLCLTGVMPGAGRLDQLDLDKSAEARHEHLHHHEMGWSMWSEPQQNACLRD